MITDSNSLASAAWNANALNSLKTAVREQPQSTTAQLAVARQVESLFVQMMLKSMREALPKDGLFNSDQTRLYTSLYDQQIAQKMAERGVGLAEAIVKQISPASSSDASSRHFSDSSPTDEHTSPMAGKIPLRLDLPTMTCYHNQMVNQIIRRAVPKIPVGQHLLTHDNRQFLMTLARPAQQLSEQSGIPHKLILAQAALESAWGQRQISTANGQPSFNLFGIKASADWKGPVAEALTTEYDNGVAKKVRAKFRVYTSYFESLADYVRLLTQNPRYANVINAHSAEQGANALQHAGYATDPAYSQKLNAIIRQISELSEKVGKAYSSDALSALF